MTKRTLFEFLILEGAQAGLSWITILRKRENYRRAYDMASTRRASPATAMKDVARLLGDAGIVRNRLKIAASIANARATLELYEQGGSLDSLLWAFVDGRPRINRWRSMSGSPRHHARGRSPVEGTQAARFPLHRPHGGLRPHAGHRHGQRPSAVLPAPRRPRSLTTGARRRRMSRYLLWLQ
jgi:DNA-3-methyladenine glycosylase I